ncbi:MAG: KH domain-containing protein [Ignavibacteria bacterium]|nr:KH domain-containing protein [Ignavibacteria bacterium]
MKAIVEFIVKQLVDKPEKVRVEENSLNENSIELVVEVDKDDIGKVIGKKGKNINAIRTLIIAIGAKEKHRVTLTVVE